MNYSKIAISSGHGKKVAGAKGFIDEVTEARKVVSKVVQYMKQVGVTVYEIHDDVSTTPSNNLSWIVKQHNGKNRQLDVSIHFNAYKKTESPMGAEVLFFDQKSLATKVSQVISKQGGFKDRGAKERKDLYFLKNTSKPAILIEVCFVDSKKDVELYNKNFDDICKGIAEAITGKAVPKPPAPTPSIRYNVLCGGFNSKKNAETRLAELKKAGFSAIIVEDCDC